MGQLSITFLGTGTSLGVPVIACNCNVCASTDARDKRTRSSIYVRTPEAAIVVDTGTDFREQCLREDIREVDAILLTHAHTDHIMGFDDLRPFCHPDRWIPIYGSAETLADLRRVFQFAFDGQKLHPGYIKPLPEPIDGPFSIGETEIVPLPVVHGRTTTFGFLFSRQGRKLAAYLSDCNSIPDPVLAQLEDVDTLIIDALRHTPHPTHLSVPEALEISRRIRARRTLFTHICHELPHDATERELPEGVRLAFDGLKIDLE